MNQDRFQSAVAHELFSDPVWVTDWIALEARFKALSRMSSSPTPPRGRWCCSSSLRFQSAVAHELFSDNGTRVWMRGDSRRFKALSRMSSSPTNDVVLLGMTSVVVSKRCRA